MRVLNNANALKALNQLRKNDKKRTKSLKKLSSGKRIETAADDAAGMAISQKMRAEIDGLQQAQENIQNGTSLLQTAEGAMDSIQDILHRMKELTIQGANDTLSEQDKESVQTELEELRSKAGRIANETKFNGMPLIDGTFSQKEEKVAGESDHNLNVLDDGTTVTRQVEIGDFMVDFNFTKLSEEKVKIDVKHDDKLLATKTITQDPIKWEKNLGGSSYDNAQDITNTSDGGYVVLGRTESTDEDLKNEKSNSDSDMWAVKLDKDKNIKWQTTLGGSDFDEGSTVQETNSGDLIISGTKTSTDGDKDISVAKLSADGDVKSDWPKPFGGGKDKGKSVYPTQDGGYILAGDSDSTDKDDDMLLMKLDQNGEFQWEKYLDHGDLFDEVNDIKQTDDNGYIVAGSNNNSGTAGMYKLDSNGEQEWHKNYSGDSVESVQELSGGGYVFAGREGSGSGSDMMIAKTEADGDQVWKKSLDNLGNFDEGVSIEVTDNDEYIVSGTTTSNNEDTDIAAVKLKEDGTKRWDTFNQGFGGNGDEGTEVTVTSDNGYLVTNPDDNSKDNSAIKFNARGAFQWETTIGGSDDQINNLKETSNGYLATGKSTDTGKRWTAKLDPDGQVTTKKDITDSGDVEKITDVQKLSSGGYALSGRKDESGNKEGWVAKLDSNLDTTNTSTFGGSSFDQINSIQETSNGYLVAGESKSSDGDLSNNYGSSDVWAAGLQDDLSLDWQKNFGGSEHDAANSIKQTSDGGYLIAGETESDDHDLDSKKADTDRDGWVIKLNGDKSIDWQKNLGGAIEDRFTDISVDEANDEYIIAGTRESIYDNDKEAWAAKFAEDGTEKWNKTFSDKNFNQGIDLKKTTDGYILSGVDDEDNKVMIKLDAAGNKSWENGLDNKDDSASSIRQTSDGGYIVAGSKTSNFGDQDGTIIKLDADGNKEWEQLVGDKYSQEEISNLEIEEDNSGDYIISGTKNDQLWAAKLNSDGTEKWSQTYDGFEASDIKEDNNGNYIISGTKTSADGDEDMTILNVDSVDGSKNWQHDFGGGDDWVGNVQETSDGGYILSGTKTSNDGDKDALVLKLDSSGDISWEQKIKENKLDEEGVSVTESDEDGYILSATKETVDGDTDVWIRKLNDNGSKDWEKNFGGDNDETAGNIQQTDDGGYIVSGTQVTDAGDKDVYAIKLNETGTKEWDTSTIGIGGSGDEEANHIQQTMDGGYIIAGQSDSTDIPNNSNQGGDDLLLAKIDKDGNLEWQDLLGGSGNDKANSVEEISEGNYMISGGTTSSDGDVDSNYGSSDMWMVNYSKGRSEVSLNPTEEASKRAKYGHGTSWLDLDEVNIDFNWKDFNVEEIDAQGKQRTEANFVVQDDAKADESNHLWAEIDNLTSEELGLDDLPKVTSASEEEIQKSLEIINEANQKVSTARAKIGSYQNRLDHTSQNVANYRTNLSESNSRIKDADMANQMMELTKRRVLAQTGQAMLAQINKMSSNIMNLVSQF
ncbi:hypothetical protein JCM15060_13630 [Halanaerobaculum tunisiense]